MMRALVAAAFLALASVAMAEDSTYRSLGFNISYLDKTFKCASSIGMRCKSEKGWASITVSAQNDGDAYRVEFISDKKLAEFTARSSEWLSKTTSLSEQDIDEVLKISKEVAEKQPLSPPPRGIAVETGEINGFLFLKVTRLSIDAWETRKRLNML